MNPLPHDCECYGCEDGWHHHENESGDPRGSAIPPDKCSACHGTGLLHVDCTRCGESVPWHLATYIEDPVQLERDDVFDGYQCLIHQMKGATP